jgi:hypothetical protein
MVFLSTPCLLLLQGCGCDRGHIIHQICLAISVHGNGIHGPI